MYSQSFTIKYYYKYSESLLYLFALSLVIALFVQPLKALHPSQVRIRLRVGSVKQSKAEQSQSAPTKQVVGEGLA
jgi:uncharacterized membrane protein